MESNMDMIFALAGLGSAVYCFYAVIMMKKSGIICRSLLLDKHTDISQCQDTEEYIKKATPLIILLGVGVLIFGVLALASIYYEVFYWPMIASIVICFAIVIVYGILISKLRKQYF